MKREFFLAAAIVALGTAAPFAAYPQEKSPAETAPTEAAVGKLAPDIQINDWIGGDGRTSLADFRGEVVFLEFWGTH